MLAGEKSPRVDPTNRNTALASAFVEELARGGVRHAVVSPGSRSTPLALALWRQPEIEVTRDRRRALGGLLRARRGAGERRRRSPCSAPRGRRRPTTTRRSARPTSPRVPLIVLTADRPPELRGIGAGQTIDQLKLYGDARCAGSAKSAPTRPTTTGSSTTARSPAAPTPPRAASRVPAPSTSTCPGASRWRRCRSRTR